MFLPLSLTSSWPCALVLLVSLRLLTVPISRAHFARHVEPPQQQQWPLMSCHVVRRIPSHVMQRTTMKAETSSGGRATTMSTDASASSGRRLAPPAAGAVSTPPAMSTADAFDDDDAALVAALDAAVHTHQLHHAPRPHATIASVSSRTSTSTIPSVPTPIHHTGTTCRTRSSVERQQWNNDNDENMGRHATSNATDALQVPTSRHATSTHAAAAAHAAGPYSYANAPPAVDPVYGGDDGAVDVDPPRVPSSSDEDDDDDDDDEAYDVHASSLHHQLTNVAVQQELMQLTQAESKRNRMNDANAPSDGACDDADDDADETMADAADDEDEGEEQEESEDAGENAVDNDVEQDDDAEMEAAVEEEEQILGEENWAFLNQVAQASALPSTTTLHQRLAAASFQSNPLPGTVAAAAASPPIPAASPLVTSFPAPAWFVGDPAYPTTSIAHYVPSFLASAYASDMHIDQLYPWQSECLLQDGGRSMRHGNLVYSAPTSGGKTLVAEILLFRYIIRYNLFRSRCSEFHVGHAAASSSASVGVRAVSAFRSLVVVPFNSLVQEKARDLQSIVRSMYQHLQRVQAPSTARHSTVAAAITPFDTGPTPLLPDGDAPKIHVKAIEFVTDLAADSHILIGVVTIEKAAMIINQLITEKRTAEIGCVVIDVSRIATQRAQRHNLELQVRSILMLMLRSCSVCHVCRNATCLATRIVAFCWNTYSPS
jgi:hypothetical protein